MNSRGTISLLKKFVTVSEEYEIFKGVNEEHDKHCQPDYWLKKTFIINYYE